MLNYSEKLKRMFICERVYVSDWFARDVQCKEHVMEYVNKIDVVQNQIAGSFGCNIEGRFSRVRTEETNLANITADLMRIECNCDLAFANAGCLRANSVFPKGPFTLKTIALIFPMPDHVVVKKIPGHILKKLLENAVSQYPKYDGRWLATSGFKYSFDPEKPVGERIILESL